MTEIRFDNQVAVITGAGGGLGKSHALLLTSRGLGWWRTISALRATYRAPPSLRPSWW
jgi:NAD(P)-dependent dehydrogenase (short-subunit alcohol dehydrogenase family)